MIDVMLEFDVKAMLQDPLIKFIRMPSAHETLGLEMRANLPSGMRPKVPRQRLTYSVCMQVISALISRKCLLSQSLRDVACS